MSESVLLHDGYFLGTWLADKFGLNTSYFSHAKLYERTTLNAGFDIQKFCGIVFVSVPDDVKKYIRQGYISTKIMQEDDLNDYEYVFELTKNTKIGFWK